MPILSILYVQQKEDIFYNTELLRNGQNCNFIYFTEKYTKII